MFRRLALASVVVLLVPALPASAKQYRAERFDVRADLRADRSLRVEESVTFAMSDGTFTSVWREVPLGRTDGIVEVAARMDGVVLPQKPAAAWAEVRRGRRTLRVTWHFPATNGVHGFSLGYRMLGVAARGAGHDEIAWVALPDEHGYRIDVATVSLRVPPGAALAPTARVRPRDAEVAAGPDGVVVTARGLSKDDAIRIDMDVAAGVLSSVPPRWQAGALERQQRGPWLLLVAGVILVAGIGWLAAFATAWAHPRDEHATARSQGGAPPRQALPAAVAARLAGRGTGLQRLVATLVELASRGTLRIDERPRGARVLGRGYDVALVAPPAGPLPHEAAALALVFGQSPHPGAVVSWRHVQRQAAGKGRRFAAALLETMRREGYVDAERLAARRTLVQAAVATGIGAAASIALAALLVPVVGGWGFAVPAALGAVAVVIGVAAGRFSVLTRRGESEAQAWRGFLAGVAAASRDKAPARTVPPDWLAWATAIGVGHLAVARMGGRERVPAWFHAAAEGGSDGGESFQALLSSAVHTAYAEGGDGGAAASAGAGAAAGGGSSGAS